MIVVAMTGGLLVVLGLAMLVLVDVPARLLRRLAVAMPWSRRRRRDS
jgi:hypothetical protein